MIPASYTYKAACAALGWPSDRRLRKDRKEGLLKTQKLGHRTVLIKRAELVRYAKEYGFQLFA
jgi:hypothetical protein